MGFGSYSSWLHDLILVDFLHLISEKSLQLHGFLGGNALPEVWELVVFKINGKETKEMTLYIFFISHTLDP